MRDSLRPLPSGLKLRPGLQHDRPFMIQIYGASWRPLRARPALVHQRRLQSADVPWSTEAPNSARGPPCWETLGQHRAPETALQVPVSRLWRRPVTTRGRWMARDTRRRRGAGREQSRNAQGLGTGHHARFPSVPSFSWAAPTPLAGPVSVSTLFPVQG